MTFPLFDRFPALAAYAARTPLCTLPTPVHRLSVLAACWGARELWVKRDDLCAPLHGGNKARKLELLVPEWRARAPRRLVGLGGPGSNWAVALAYYAGREGFTVANHQWRIPGSWHPPARAAVCRRWGTLTVHPGQARWAAAVAGERLRAARTGTWVLPPGGAGLHADLAYVNAALELALQVRAGLLPEPAGLVVPLGSGGTAVGLAMGLALTSLRTVVYGVRVVPLAWVSAAHVRLHLARLHARLGARLGRRLPWPRRWRVVKGYAGSHYARPTPASRAACRDARADGLALEPVYTGKALAALATLVRARPRVPWLFWNTYNSRPLAPLMAP